DLRWPKISVVVCTYNGASTIRDTLEALRDLDYPAFEVIVVNDGSTDETARIVSTYPYRNISEENQGLSRARNTGIAAATGEIVAFMDDDAYPDPHWLRFLALSFMEGNSAAVSPRRSAGRSASVCEARRLSKAGNERPVPAGARRLCPRRLHPSHCRSECPRSPRHGQPACPPDPHSSRASRHRRPKGRPLE